VFSYCHLLWVTAQPRLLKPFVIIIIIIIMVVFWAKDAVILFAQIIILQMKFFCVVIFMCHTMMLPNSLDAWSLIKASGMDGFCLIRFVKAHTDNNTNQLENLMKVTATEIAPAVILLFQASLDQGKVPASWKMALVVPVVRKGHRSSAANYRPVSLASILCKLCEHTTISSRLDRIDILSDAQHGFRKNRSCETQLLLTVDDLAGGLGDKGQTDMTLLDFSQPFDKVSLWQGLLLTRSPTSNYYSKLHVVVLQAPSLLGLKMFCTAEPKKSYLKAVKLLGSSHFSSDSVQCSEGRVFKEIAEQRLSSGFRLVCF